MKVNEFGYWLQSLGFFALAFLFSYSLFPYYLGGDQEHYRAFYSEVTSYSLVDGFEYYQSALGSREPFYFIIVYFLSPYFDKDVLVSFFNGLVIFLVFRLFLLYRVSSIVLIWFFLNFYLLVIFFAAERLKFGLLLCLLALNYSGRWRWFVWGGALLFHAQTAFLFMGAVLSSLRYYVARIISGFLPIRFIYLSLLGLLGGGGVFLVLSEHVYSKVSAYTSSSLEGYDGGGVGILKPVLFLFMTLLYAKGKSFEAILLHLPIVFGAFVFGSERLVIFSFVIFLYFSLRVNRGLNLGVFTTGAYFNYKGIIFIMNFIANGDGFYVAG